LNQAHYAVIFRARFVSLQIPADKEYVQTILRMRDLALTLYGCLEIFSVMEKGEEVTISYWSNEDQIITWKQDKEHIAAQNKGSKQWYESYKIEVVKIVREYSDLNSLLIK